MKTDKQTRGQHREDGDPPCRRRVDRQDGVLQQGAEDADESDLGSDGKVDMARYDH